MACFLLRSMAMTPLNKKVTFAALFVGLLCLWIIFPKSAYADLVAYLPPALIAERFLSSSTSLLITFLTIVFCESFVMKLQKWGPLGKSLFDSFVANIPTTLIGAWFLSAINPFNGWGFGFLVLYFLILYAMTVVLEGFCLKFVRKESNRSPWRISILMNATSYAIILLIVMGISSSLSIIDRNSSRGPVERFQDYDKGGNSSNGR